MPTHPLQKGLLPATLTCLIILATCGDDDTPTLPRVATRLAIEAGDLQAASTSSSITLSVRAIDRDGNPVPGTTVHWAAVKDGSVSPATSVTNGAGIATTQRTLGFWAGEYHTTAALAGITTATVRFTSIAQIQGATEITLSPANNGNDQRDSVRATLAPYRVLVRDHLGTPVPGVVVRWTQTLGRGTVSEATSMTDVNGIAQTVHTLGDSAGARIVEASVVGLIGDPVRFSAAAFPGKVTAVIKVKGDGQVAYGNTLLRPYEVAAADSYGNTAPGTFAWSVVSGGGSIGPTTSNLAAHTLGPDDGPQSVSVAAIGAPSSARTTFTSTAVNALVAVSSDFYYGRSFQPQTVTIPAGQAVGWSWDGACSYFCFPEQHNVTFEDEPLQPISSPSQLSGGHVRTFTTPKTIRYRCTIHSTSFAEGMVGTVVVL